jgi:hypothetical protein
VDQVTVTRDGASYFLAPITGTVKCLLDGFHREVSLTTLKFPIGDGSYLKGSFIPRHLCDL